MKRRLEICRKCENFSEDVSFSTGKPRFSCWVAMNEPFRLSETGFVDSDVPQGCRYRMEHEILGWNNGEKQES